MVINSVRIATDTLTLWTITVAFWLKLPKSKQPKWRCFESVKEAVEDELKQLSSVLVQYQTKALMILEMLMVLILYRLSEV